MAGSLWNECIQASGYGYRFYSSVDKTEDPAAQKKCHTIWDILNTLDTENGSSFIGLITFEGVLKSIDSHLTVAFVCNYWYKPDMAGWYKPAITYVDHHLHYQCFSVSTFCYFMFY